MTSPTASYQPISSHVAAIHCPIRGFIVELLVIDIDVQTTVHQTIRYPEFADDAHAYCKLMIQKELDSVQSHERSPQQMWQSIKKLFGRGHYQTTFDLTTDVFHRFIAEITLLMHLIHSLAPSVQRWSL